MTEPMNAGRTLAEACRESADNIGSIYVGTDINRAHLALAVANLRAAADELEVLYPLVNSDEADDAYDAGVELGRWLASGAPSGPMPVPLPAQDSIANLGLTALLVASGCPGERMNEVQSYLSGAAIPDRVQDIHHMVLIAMRELGI